MATFTPTRQGYMVRGSLGDAPVTPTHGDSTILPVALIVNMVLDSAIDVEWSLLKAEISGPKIKVNGEPGKAWDSRGYFYLDNCPTWLADLIRSIVPKEAV